MIFKAVVTDAKHSCWHGSSVGGEMKTFSYLKIKILFFYLLSCCVKSEQTFRYDFD